jgi:hypothetical protein
MGATFTTTVVQAEGKQATGLRVPPEVVATLGSHKKPPVKVTIADYTYRSTIAAYADNVFMLPLAAEHRETAGVKAGDEVEVTLELDQEPRTVEVPEDLASALEGAGLTAAFDRLSYSVRKEYVRQVESAKAQETRERRIASIVAKLGSP